MRAYDRVIAELLGRRYKLPTPHANILRPAQMDRDGRPETRPLRQIEPPELGPPIGRTLDEGAIPSVGGSNPGRTADRANSTVLLEPSSRRLAEHPRS